MTTEHREKNLGLAIAIAAFAVVFPAIAWAHVSVSPRESTPGATEKYTIRVPAEGTVTSTSVELDVPAGVTVETVAVPVGWRYAMKKEGDRIVGITWTMDIKPGEFAEFAFVARNPRDQAQIVWPMRQHFADGAVTDWTTTANGTRATAITKLNPPKAPRP